MDAGKELERSEKVLLEKHIRADWQKHRRLGNLEEWVRGDIFTNALQERGSIAANNNKTDS